MIFVGGCEDNQVKLLIAPKIVSDFETQTEWKLALRLELTFLIWKDFRAQVDTDSHL